MANNLVKIKSTHRTLRRKGNLELFPAPLQYRYHLDGMLQNYNCTREMANEKLWKGPPS